MSLGFSVTIHSESTTSVQKVNGLAELDLFAKSMKFRNKPDLLKLLPKEGLFVYRGFTSGNYGARGSETRMLFSSNYISDKLTIDVKKQLPIDLAGAFPSLDFNSSKSLAQYCFDFGLSRDLPISNTLNILKGMIGSKTESESGIPFILASNDGNFIVFSNALVIDDILVGGIAIFKLEGDNFYLYAVFELL
jgi:hypothetical protein